VLAITCPGQGAQTPGFLLPWLDVPGVAERLGWLSAVSGVDLLTHGTTSDADTIRDTAIAQPLIVGAALAIAPCLLPDGDRLPVPAGTAVAGHSVGEFAAAALAGVLTGDQAIVLVRERGRAMAAASAVTATGMSAVVGGRPEEVAAALEAAGLTAANVNGAGQVVAAGTMEQLAALAASPPGRARVIPLQVAGAFHTHHMAPAVGVLAQLAAAVPASDPHAVLLSNSDGAAVASGQQALDRLVSQVSSPVRWDACMQTMSDLGVSAMIELAPAGTLAGLAKRALPGVELLALRSPEDLAAARDLVAAHTTPSGAAL
jgi:[acyl-carrier-protein] S-malonyltransferase